MNKEKKIFIESAEYIYRAEHLTLEGTCSKDHGPRKFKIKQRLVDKYPVPNNEYLNLLRKQVTNLLTPRDF